MINRKYIALVIAIVIFIVSGCTSATTPTHVYRIKEEPTFITVCSDTATVEEIETYATRQHSEFGESTGLIWQLDSQCVTFNK